MKLKLLAFSGWLAFAVLAVFFVVSTAGAQSVSGGGAYLRVWHDDGTVQEFECAGIAQDATPTPEGETATPAPQATVTPMLTASPTALVEPPIPTAQPTATPWIITPIPTEELVQCVAKNPYTATTINVRETYAITGKYLFALPAQGVGIVGQIYEKSSTESWAYIAFGEQHGWVALKVGGAAIAVLQGDCSNIIRGPVSAGGPFRL